MKASFLCFSLSVCSLASFAFGESVPVDNGGFESGEDGWIFQEKDLSQPMSSVQADAAHEGKMGLRVDDQDPKKGSNAASRPIPVEAGQTYKLSFFARTKAGNRGAVYLRFANTQRAAIDPTKFPMVTILKGGEQWEPYSLTATAPDGAATVSIWVHTWSGAVGVIDLDDFTLEKVEGGAEASAPAAAKVVPEAASTPYPKTTPRPVKASVGPRTKPATIIIKVDDLKTNPSGHMPAAWDRFAKMIKDRGIKAGIGIICESLEGDKPAYFKWIKDQKETGLFEFWNHGYDHREWKEGDKTLHEFQGPSYEVQKQHVMHSQELAKQKLGFSLATFGPGYGATDENTVRVLQEDPDTKIWLYSKPLEAKDKLPEGKVILDRIWQVNIEHPTFVPNFEMFKAGFESNPKRDYFVIQGHPSHWKEEGWPEFEKILDYLKEQGAIFVTPSEYVASHPHPETVLSASPEDAKAAAAGESPGE